jgi:chromosome segregation ATPase
MATERALKAGKAVLEYESTTDHCTLLSELANMIDREAGLPELEAQAARVEHLEGEINRLAEFIMTNVAGEPSQSQGACDTAIRVIGELRARVEELTEEAASWRRTLETTTCERDALAQRVEELESKLARAKFSLLGRDALALRVERAKAFCAEPWDNCKADVRQSMLRILRGESDS